MQLLKEEKFNKATRGTFEYRFDISEKGLYLIEINARAKSWWQNLVRLRSFFKDDDLTIKINNIEFPKLSGKKGLFDGEVAWNGNNLVGLKKTVVFFMNLDIGTHTLNFLADQKPYLENIKIYQIRNLEKISYLPEDNNPAEDGDRRQWVTIVLVSQPLNYLFIRASAKNYRTDDDDVKLIIDGHIEGNTESKSHSKWFWCGRTLKGDSKEFTNNLNLPVGLHYIELWADKTPFLNKIELDLGLIESKRIPTVDDPQWTGNFRDDPEEVLLARLIFGEARGESREAKIWVAGSVINRVESEAWPDTIHDVILQPGQYDAIKLSDRNYRYVINPLWENKKADMLSWQECYEIAKGIISGELQNPTTATHFHSFTKIEDIKNFEKRVVPNGKFLKKIGIMQFYWSPN